MGDIILTIENQCKTCIYFERQKLHKDIDPLEEDQRGGYCPIIQNVLSMDNSFLWNNKLYIQDTFGCILHKDK